MAFYEIQDAVREVSKELLRQENKRLSVVLDLNQGRYKLLYLFNEKAEREVILVVFKREHFLSFNKQFNNESGHGESINKDDLQKAIDRGVNRVFVAYPDGKIYMIHSKVILERAMIRSTNEENKETYSFDMALLTRYNTET